jgi:hypothetical protein
MLFFFMQNGFRVRLGAVCASNECNNENDGCQTAGCRTASPLFLLLLAVDLQFLKRGQAIALLADRAPLLPLVNLPRTTTLSEKDLYDRLAF